MRIEVKDLPSVLAEGKEVEKKNEEIGEQIEAVRLKYDGKGFSWLEAFDMIIFAIILFVGTGAGILARNWVVTIIAAVVLVAFMVLDYKLTKKADRERNSERSEVDELSAQYLDTTKYEIAKALEDSELLGYGDLYDCDNDEYCVNMFLRQKGTNICKMFRTYVACKNCNDISGEYFDLDNKVLYVKDLDTMEDKYESNS